MLNFAEEGKNTLRIIKQNRIKLTPQNVCSYFKVIAERGQEHSKNATSQQKEDTTRVDGILNNILRSEETRIV